MPAKNRRINVVLERPVYATLARLARREGTSLPVKARDLLREALESHEDRVLVSLAASRDRTCDRSRSLSHAEVWKSVRKDELRPEYDFASMKGGVRGKYAARLRKEGSKAVKPTRRARGRAKKRKSARAAHG